MDIRQLRYFISVLDAKSLNKAAALLHVAQPALGVQISNLEQELGVKLLRRHSRGVEPTDIGKRLARQAEPLLEKFERLRQDVIDHAASPSGPVLLCIGRALPRIVAATIAERCQKKFPDIQLSIVGVRQHLDVASKAIETDLALTFRPHYDDHSVLEPLVKDELLLVSAAQRRLPREINFYKLTERPLILPSEPHYVRRLAETAARQAGCELQIHCNVDSLTTTIELVKRGAADTLLPLCWVREHVKAAKFRTARIREPKLQRTLYMLHSSHQSHGYAVDLVRREIRAIIFEFASDGTFGWKKINEQQFSAG
jgi:LysR family transcriptional regulator, nitrogen assimilation regulatory protein